MPTAKDLTVVITTIPTRKDRLAKAYQSVEDQTLQPAQIIVQEDTQKLGAPANRDAGLSRVKTPYVAFLDDDDYFYPDHLETLYKAAQETDADIVYSWFDVEGGTDPFPENFGRPWNPEQPIQTTVTTLCKTEVVRAAGGFSNTYGLNEEELATFAQGNTIGEDFRMVAVANNNGAKIVHVPKKTWAYVHWAGNTSGMPERWELPSTDKVLIIVPSRNRPENASRLLRRIQRTIPPDANLTVIFAVDHDDLSLENYPLYNTLAVYGGNMVKALNEVATLKASEYDFIGFLGDDTLPHGDWYARILAELKKKENSIVYGNDLINGPLLPTAAFMDANIVRTLGFMAPPAQKHLYVDNFWKELGTTLGTLTYLDDVIIEHLHPHGGKAPSDEIYAAAYTAERWDHDSTAFGAYMETNFLNDIKRFK